MSRGSQRVVPALLAAAAGLLPAGCGSTTPALTETPNAHPPTLTVTVDPCTLFTDAEVRVVLGEARGPRPEGSPSRTTCLLPGASQRQSLRVAVFGDAGSAPSVFSRQLRSSAEPQKVLGVGRAAFAVFRPDEVGIVTMTRRTVLTVSVVSAQGPIADPDGVLARMTPVVRQASGRI